MAMRGQLQPNRIGQRPNSMAQRQQGARTLLADRHSLRADRIANGNVFRDQPLCLARGHSAHPLIAPAEAVRFIGQPLRTVTST